MAKQYVRKFQSFCDKCFPGDKWEEAKILESWEVPPGEVLLHERP